MRILRLIFSDFLGLAHTCGWAVALRWLLAILLRLPECKRLGNLSPADRIFGDGPLRVCRNGHDAWLVGNCVLTGIREVWVRDSYLKDHFLTIPDDALVVDLGAGAGTFTILTTTLAKNVRAITIEAEQSRCVLIKQAAQLNNLSSRVKVINAYVGGQTDYGKQIFANPSNQDVPTLSESDLMTEINQPRIDVLKCDIEGSEFALLRPDSPLLSITQQLAMEVHPACGNADELISGIKSAGFELLIRPQGPTMLVFGRRTTPLPAATPSSRPT